MLSNIISLTHFDTLGRMFFTCSRIVLFYISSTNMVLYRKRSQ